jgi:glycosyltransferase involved in cell wall biosynthesis
MRIRLIQPPPAASITGAAVYNARIAEALAAVGHTVDPDSGEATLIDSFAQGAASDGATVLVHHPRALETDPPDPALRAAEAALFDRARHLVTTSQQTADQLTASFGVPPQKITVIVPGIDDLPRSPGSPGPTAQVLSIGQLVPRKGHDTLLRALTKLFDLDWHLTIAGPPTDPVHAAGLQALAEDLNISRHVTFAGQATGAALEALWHQADLFALTPHYEGYGMVFAEALRRGLPVVATHVGAVPTLLVPDAGTITAPGDTDQLAKALRRLIFDRALRRDMAEAAWQSARDLPSWAEQAARLAAVLAAHK